MVQETAKKYLELGWSVFPLLPNAKTPGLKWNQYREQRMTPDDAAKLFRPDSNIALACGPLSGIIVVDLDSYKGKPGIENIDSPLKAITPRGGMHLFFKYTDGLNNTVNEARATDIRADGGYVALAPSVIQYEDGTRGQYIWLTEPTKEILEALPEAPESLLRVIYGQNDSQATLDQKTPVGAKIGEDWAPIGEGGRNNEINRFAFKYMNIHKDSTTVWNMVLARNAGFTPPLPMAELKRTFDSAVKGFVQKDQSAKQTHYLTTEMIEKAKTDNPYIHQRLNNDVDFTILQLAQGKKKGLSTGFIELDALCGGFIPGQSYLFYADTNVGKSVFSLNMLVNMAKRGVKCLYFDLENDTALSTERLMLVANEGKVHLQEYRAQLAMEPVDMEYLKSIFAPVIELDGTLDVWSMTKMLDRYGEITWAGIHEVMLEHKNVQVVVIDHLHYFSPAETDHAVLGEISRQINNIAGEMNLAIVCVAHTKKGLFDTKKPDKNGDEKVRAFRPTIDHISGSSMIAKHFKNLIAISRNYLAQDDEQFETRVFVDKTKYGPSGHFDLWFDPMTLRFSPWSLDHRMVQTKLRAMDDMLEEEVKLPLIDEKPKIAATIQEDVKKDIVETTPVVELPIVVETEVNIEPPKRVTKVDTPNPIDDSKLNDIPF